MLAYAYANMYVSMVYVYDVWSVVVRGVLSFDKLVSHQCPGAYPGQTHRMK